MKRAGGQPPSSQGESRYGANREYNRENIYMGGNRDNRGSNRGDNRGSNRETYAEGYDNRDVGYYAENHPNTFRPGGTRRPYEEDRLGPGNVGRYRNPSRGSSSASGALAAAKARNPSNLCLYYTNNGSCRYLNNCTRGHVVRRLNTIIDEEANSGSFLTSAFDERTTISETNPGHIIRNLYTGGRGNTLSWWKLDNNRSLIKVSKSTLPQEGDVTALAYASNLLAVGQRTGYLTIFNMAIGSNVSLPGHEGQEVLALCFVYPNGFISSDFSGNVIVWKLSGDGSLQEHFQPMARIQAGPVKSLLFVSLGDANAQPQLWIGCLGSLHVYSLAEMSLLAQIPLLNKNEQDLVVGQVLYTPNRSVYLYSHTGALYRVTCDALSVYQKLQLAQNGTAMTAAIKDVEGPVLLLGQRDGLVGVFRIDTSTLMTKIPSHDAEIRVIASIPDDLNTFISADMNNHLSLYTFKPLTEEETNSIRAPREVRRAPTRPTHSRNEIPQSERYYN